MSVFKKDLEKKWSELCADVTSKMMDGFFKNNNELVEYIKKKFNKDIMVICTHQYLVEKAFEIAKKTFEDDNNISYI